MNNQTAVSLKDFEHADNSRSATQRAYHDIRKLIINGEIAPSEQLKVESLKVLLRTSASPIREALSLLTSDQLVERIDQRGFRSAPVSKTHFQEILMLRCQLEGLAIRNSIQSGDKSWEENLVLSHYRLQQSDRTNAEEWERQHRAFHSALLQGCNSPILLRYCDQLYDLNIRYRFLAGKSGRYSKRNINDEHKDILDATLARDETAAANQLAQHYELTGQFLSTQFDDGV